LTWAVRLLMGVLRGPFSPLANAGGKWPGGERPGTRGRVVNIRYLRRSLWRAKARSGNTTGKREVWVCLEISVDMTLTLRYVPWAGWLPVCIRGPRGKGRVLREYPHWNIKDMKRRNMSEVAQVANGDSLAEQTTILFSKFPALIKQLSVVKYEDGSPRTPGGLLVSTQGSMWRVAATEPDECLRLPFMAQALDDALAALELALASESIPWEIDQWAIARRGKKKK